MSETRIVTASEIAGMDGLKKTHFLNDNAKRVNKSLGDLVGINGFGIHLIEVEPGHETTEHHAHYFEDECVFILEGTATSRIGDVEEDVGPGDFIGYPAGGPAHSLLNTGTTVLKCLVVGDRLDHDVADYPNLGKRIYRNAGMPWNLVDLDAIDTPTGGAKK